MGSWTGKYDPLRKLHDSAKKNLGFDPSIMRNVHVKLANKAHSAADNYLNQEPEGSENRAANRRKAEELYFHGRGRQAEHDIPQSMRKASRRRGLTIMGGA